MTVKLNLTVNEERAEYIKKYAAKRKTSVSKIVDEYFDSIMQQEKKKLPSKKSFVEKYGGIISGKLLDIDKARDEYLKEKYGI